MNWLMFITGAGVGMCGTGLLFLYVLASVTKNNKKNDAHMQRTDDLLSERNRINAKIENHLLKVADWCDHNWNRQ